MAESSDAGDWRSDLIKRYLGQFKSPYPDVSDGWHELLEILFARISNILKANPDCSFGITQIKEKLGMLRFYYYVECPAVSIKDAIRLAVDLAEARSACTCEICGEAGQLYNHDRHLTTRCPHHATGSRIRLSPYWQNLYILIDGTDLKAKYRRYVRETDSFTSLTPGTEPDLDGS